MKVNDCLTEMKIDRDQMTAGAILACPSEFPAFEGHFPGDPVLPAVMQLAAVRILAEEILEQRLIPVMTDRVKFKGMIKPDQMVKISISIIAAEEGWLTKFYLRDGEVTLSSGKMTFQPQGDAG